MKYYILGGLIGVLLMLGSFAAFDSLMNQYVRHEPKTAITSTKTIEPPSASEIENRINAFRSEKGLSQLADNAKLDEAARVRADAMCAANDWSHAKDWETLAPYYAYSYAGENLYYGFLQEEQERVAVENWVASPTHLENIVGNYSEIGIAVKYCPGFQNEPTAVIITNYFGVPR